MRIARAGLWAAAAALCGLKLAGTLRGHVDGGFYVGNALSTATGNVYVVSHKLAYAEFVVALVVITLGVLVWDRRPDSRTGILLTAVPIVGLLTDPIVFAGSRVQHPRPRAADRRDHPRWELHLEPWSPEHPRYSSWN